ncbi:MAG: isopentenyl-diphosphate delta-isomerase [Candidatus Thermoplasmatota archaeon]|nr:isopentenyl-diphosphate delta-isomerase [Candidatus Thermoplasmatota archaeon]
MVVPSNPLDGLDSSQAEMMEELVLCLDSDDNVIDSSSKFTTHHGEGILHRAFSVLIFDSEGRLLVQQRSSDKITFPAVWANSCCSHPLDIDGENDDPIEGVKEAARRKLDQELGIPRTITNDWKFHHIGRFEYKCRWDSEWVEHEIDHVLIVEADCNVDFNRNEIQYVDWLDNDSLIQMMERKGRWKSQLIAPWFEAIFNNFLGSGDLSIDWIISNKKSEIIRCGELSVQHPENSASNVLAALGQHKEVVEGIIQENLSKIQQERLRGAMSHLFTGGGKRLRAIMPRLVGDAVGNGHQGHYTLGACIEIIHNFTLVHDDIMDQDPIRRGLDAVHVAYDDPTAINAGDAMLALGFEMLADSSHIEDSQLRHVVSAIGQMVRHVAEGQQEDFEFEDRDSVSEEEYISMIAGKTSAMFETCAETGAILAGADNETVANMANWGLNLGLCFQIMDDYIDMTSDTETLGKPAGSDIVQGKRTLIAIHALESGAELPTFHKLFGTESTDTSELAVAVQELNDNGSIQYALDRAMEHHRIAHGCLDKLEQTPAVDLLRDMTDFQLVRIN